MLSALFLAAIAGAAPAPAPRVLHVPGGRISLTLAAAPRAATEGAIARFVARSAEPVSLYYGKFPVPELSLEVEPNPRRPNGLFGREFHGNRVVFYLGASAGDELLADDQILTHEMFHLGFPDLARDYAWVEEGLATYLAHLARARAGQTTEAELWRDAHAGFTDAQRRPGEGGFADEEDYHRMYWGGALLWFAVDLEIRERSKGERSLDTATRAILAAGGTNAKRWGLARLTRAVDRAAGFPVFGAWYGRLARKAGTVDLEAAWKKLGIRFEGKSAVLEPGNALRAALLKNLPPPPAN